MESFFLDAEWTPAEIAERNRRAMDYSDECEVKWRDRSRKVTTFVQRSLAFSFGLLFFVLILALLVG